MSKTHLILAFTVFAGLVACGGGGGGGGNESPLQPSGIDGFTSVVSSMVASAPDDTEPVSVDSTATVETDGTEPMSVG